MYVCMYVCAYKPWWLLFVGGGVSDQYYCKSLSHSSHTCVMSWVVVSHTCVMSWVVVSHICVMSWVDYEPHMCHELGGCEPHVSWAGLLWATRVMSWADCEPHMCHELGGLWATHVSWAGWIVSHTCVMSWVDCEPHTCHELGGCESHMCHELGGLWATHVSWAGWIVSHTCVMSWVAANNCHTANCFIELL